MFAAKVLADSVSPVGYRLTTIEVTYPRIIHGEMLRHRMFSRCAASSRAIPARKFIEQVLEHPYIPSSWGQNQPGMQADELLPPDVAAWCEQEWLAMRDDVVRRVTVMAARGLHKQLVNRPLEAWQWMTEVITATNWGNFFNLRDHAAAHPDIQTIAKLMRSAMSASVPTLLEQGQWHTPLLDDAEKVGRDCREQCLISVGRVARVSYLKHDDVSTVEDDIKRAEKMLLNGHMSPFEHAARPMTDLEVSRYWTLDATQQIGRPVLGNFTGWVQFRKTLPNESDPLSPDNQPTMRKPYQTM